MKLSAKGAKLIQAFEGCLKPIGNGRFKPYLCPAGVLTIGWGHTNHHGRPFNRGSVWTQQECDDAFAEDMVGFEDIVKRLVRVTINQDQSDALVSFSYNAGAGALEHSTLLKKVNRKDFEGAAREFAKWNKAHVGGVLTALPGLTRRRASEALLFQGIADVDYDGRPDRVQPKHPMPQEVAEPEAVQPEAEAVAPPESDEPEELPDAMPQAVEPPKPEKSILKSKEAAGGTLISGTSVGDAVGQASDTLDKVKSAKDVADDVGLWDFVGPVISNPRFLFAVAIAVVGIAIIYWRYRRNAETGA